MVPILLMNDPCWTILMLSLFVKNYHKWFELMAIYQWQGKSKMESCFVKGVTHEPANRRNTLLQFP